MADLVKLVMIRGCDEVGVGGEKLDTPAVVLPPNTLAAIFAAFAFHYPSDAITPNPDFKSNEPESVNNPKTLTLAPEHAFARRLRLFTEGVTVSHLQKQGESAALAAAKTAGDSLINATQFKTLNLS